MKKEVDAIYNKYIEDKCDIYLSKKDDFINAISSSEILVVILKGHLYIESALLELLSEVINIKEIESDMSFKQKLDLARSLNLISKDTYCPINKFNKIRNQYSHNVNYVFEEKEYNDLLSTLRKKDKDQLMECRKLGQENLKINFLTDTMMLLYIMWRNIQLHKALAIETMGDRMRARQAEVLVDYIMENGGSNEEVQKIINHYITF
jgi:hypothetical protein